jgi:hypothetical protein
MTEMDKLIRLMGNSIIPHEIVMHEPTHTLAIVYPSRKNYVCDAVCHEYSYGGSLGLLEIMGLVGDDIPDDVEGWLTAEEVFNRIRKHYCENYELIDLLEGI